MAKNTKAAAILEMINKGMTNKEIRSIMNISPSYLWKLRNEMAHKAEEEKVKPGEFIEVEEGLTPNEIDAILDARGSRYGNFYDHARVTYELKAVARSFANEKDKVFDYDQMEAIDMIFHKIGRILNGDPNYADSWLDIAGYAKLVADRLQGTIR